MIQLGFTTCTAAGFTTCTAADSQLVQPPTEVLVEVQAGLRAEAVVDDEEVGSLAAVHAGVPDGHRHRARDVAVQVAFILESKGLETSCV
jgi:hypothetical protein